jgi:hypothetical protein
VRRPDGIFVKNLTLCPTENFGIWTEKNQNLHANLVTVAVTLSIFCGRNVPRLQKMKIVPNLSGKNLA